jgi:hypothetical protein
MQFKIYSIHYNSNHDSVARFKKRNQRPQILLVSLQVRISRNFSPNHANIKPYNLTVLHIPCNCKSVFIYHQHYICAVSAFLCRFTCHWIGQLAFALFHGNINLTSVDFGKQNSLKYIKLYPV